MSAQGGDGARDSGGSTAEPGNAGAPAEGEGGAGAVGVAGMPGAVGGVTGEGGSVAQPDEEPPTVLSISPELGEAGVANDAKVEITFSEPMDKVATQAAFQSANLGGVTFDWPSDDVLVVTPNAPLAYATGTSLSVAAKIYGFSVTTAAQDLAGNGLKAAKTSEFATLRELTMIAPRSDKFWVYDDGTVRTPAHPALNEGVMVGDLYMYSAMNNEWIRAAIAFDVGQLPVGIEDFLSATLSVSICCAVGNPASLGGIYVDHINVATFTTALTAVAPLSNVGVLTETPSPGKKTLDVTEAFADAYAKRAMRGNVAQFRFQFEPPTNDDDMSDSVELDETPDGPDAARISATFLIP